MGMTIEENRVKFNAVIYEDEVVPLRDYLQATVPDPVVFDFQECQDLHLAVLQEIMAYKKLYQCTYVYGDTVKIYQKLLEGFDPVEDHCS